LNRVDGMNETQEQRELQRGGKSLLEGHRERLRKRFEKNGIASLHLHEIVELILSYVIPRHDTKPLAHELVRRFKTLSALLNASPEELSKVKGIGRRSATLFAFIREISAHCLREKYSRKPMVAHRRDVEEYLRFHFGMRPDEYVAVLFLANRNQILETEVLAEGTVNQCAVYPRVIMERALHYHATSIIVAHNHPGGGLNPSEADWVLTERLFEICALLEIPMLDHLIISQEQVVSLKDFPRWPGNNKDCRE
jgi:DNA repair protein RadC